jgi:hypothetical protein
MVEITREMWKVRMTKEQVFTYLEQNLPPVELEDGRLITFKEWVIDYIRRGIDDGIRAYLGSRY